MIIKAIILISILMMPGVVSAQLDMSYITGTAYTIEYDYMLYPDSSTYYSGIDDSKDDTWSLGFTRYGPAMYDTPSLYCSWGKFYGGPWH
jgi:hypothetical protein